MTDHVKDQLCARIEELEAEKTELNEQLDIAQREAAEARLQAEGVAEVCSIYRGERDALAAHVKRLVFALETARDAIASLDIDALGSVPETHDCPAYPIRDAVINDLTVAINRKPATSLARLKAQWQAEALEELIQNTSQFREANPVRGLAGSMADELRQQAEGGES